MRKHLAIIALAASSALAACATKQAVTIPPAYAEAQADIARLRARASQQPLLAPWTGPYGGVPPWDSATPENVPAAFELGVALREAEVQAIANDPAAATFENTIAALDDVGRHLDRASSVFGVMTSNITTPEIQALEAEWSPRLAAAYDAIHFNQPLFARIDELYARREGLGLDAEQLRLLERTRDRFVRAGAVLEPDAQARLGAINEALAASFAEFDRRLLADEDTAIFVTRARDLAGLPNGLREACAAAAAERGRPGEWAIVNTRSIVDPFLTFSTNRALRERVWLAFKNRGDNGDGNDTNAILSDILRLRAERALILGFPTHAQYRMDDTMAKDPARARELMLRVWPAAVARVHEEVADMQAIADREQARITIEPWDYLHYSERVRRDRFDLDQNELREYFQLDEMIEAAFWMSEQLYGLSYDEVTGRVPVFDPKVRVWEVHDRDGSLLGLFYGDYFARPGKSSGAWMTTYRLHETFSGKRTTIASNNNNFAKGADGEPVLISLDDAETLFHEFGHAIHYLVSTVAYPGLASTPQDYVEYPSQVHEHWVLTRPVLDRFARHHRTGEPMPDELVERVHEASTFNQGYATVEYLSAALVDMALHDRAEPVADPDAFERETLAALGMPREIAMRHRLPHFGHLFSGDDYSAGYYSYLWSEVMDADTWEYFEASGNVFDPTIAAGMRDIILAEGNTSDRAAAYRRFRGRDPDVDALLRVRGLPTGEAAPASGRGE
jgi:peptidyl-dipeptidase Dcp